MNWSTYLFIKEAKENTITYSSKFSDVKNIVDTLSKNELHHICSGTFKDSPYVVYRSVLLCNNDPAAFIEVYSSPEEMNDDEAVLVVVCKKKYRNNGYASILVSKMKKRNK